MNKSKGLAQVIEYEQILKSAGCRTVYEGDWSQGFQRLMFDPNSGSVFSVELVPVMEKVEIRSANSQKNEFVTSSILEGITSGVPLFSQYKKDNYWDLPLISLEEEYHLPGCSPMHARVLALPGAPVDADEVYFQIGLIPGVDDKLIAYVEQEYCNDVKKYNDAANQILHEKMGALPEMIQAHYHYQPNKYLDVYSIPKQIRR